jgi:DNA-binding IclR family transcriptional regulator
MSSVGISVLATLPDSETQATYARHAAAYERIGITLDRLQRLVRTTRHNGFAETTDPRTAETSGVGCAFLLSSHAHAGISVAAINSRMPPERRKDIGARLLREVQPLAWTPEAAPPGP